jgi:hypothetical protein
MAEKILAAHAGLPEVVPGQLIECDLDAVLANDITAPIAIKTVREIGAGVFDPRAICLVPDHYSPNKDIKSAEQTKVTRDFAHEMGITHYFEQGCMGIEHALLPERGIVGPVTWSLARTPTPAPTAASARSPRRGLHGRRRGHGYRPRLVQGARDHPLRDRRASCPLAPAPRTSSST